ncbi:hypothetical protein [Streptomyces sp. NPDC090021]|uniref:hypothetical protein n=1 Tax=Streptomyces sp. NPDC090021 TaxID=3365919 RepID=UPI0038241ECE
MTADAHEIAFRQRADRMQTRGIFLLVAAGCIWLALAYQLFAPFSIKRDANGSIECASRVFYDDGDDDSRQSRRKTYEDAEGIRCAIARDPADMLGLLLLSLPLAAIGISQYTSGALSLTLRHHKDEVAYLKSARTTEPADPAGETPPA